MRITLYQKAVSTTVYRNHLLESDVVSSHDGGTCSIPPELMLTFPQVGLLKSMSIELVKIAPNGRVNCVAPGWVNTPMATEALQNPQVVYEALAT